MAFRHPPQTPAGITGSTETKAVSADTFNSRRDKRNMTPANKAEVPMERTRQFCLEREDTQPPKKPLKI